jgi:hypothetical protein
MEKWAHELSRDFSKEEIQMASKLEVQIKTTLRFHLTLVIKARIKGNNNKWR